MSEVTLKSLAHNMPKDHLVRLQFDEMVRVLTMCQVEATIMAPRLSGTYRSAQMAIAEECKIVLEGLI